MIPILNVVSKANLFAQTAALSAYDALVVLSSKTEFSADVLPAAISRVITQHLAISGSSQGPFVLHSSEAPQQRIVYARVPSVLGDTADPRNVFFSLGRKISSTCLSVGATRPLVCFVDPLPVDRKGKPFALFANAIESTLLGCLHQAYVPLQAREVPGKSPAPCLTEIGIVSDHLREGLVPFVAAVEAGKLIARDIGGADPERMAPLKAAKYIMDAFKGTENVKITVEKDPQVLLKEFPLLHAVSRASLHVRLEYNSPEPSQVKENLFFIGKGVTYDTGGADVKTGGAMRGMSRDKCGAAGVAGFFKTLSMVKPKHFNAVAYLGFVRNSIGSDAYVGDEIIVSRAGVRVLVVNTDAEGRMVMADLLAKAKEEVLAKGDALTIDGSQPARLFTVATLTGHAVRAVGPYTCILDNGPARESGMAHRIAQAATKVADPMEVTSLRQDDYDFVKPFSLCEDVAQSNDRPSTMTSRGHQFPMAFLSVASGLKDYGLDSQFPISYTHMDIAGAAEEPGSGTGLGPVTGTPVAGLAAAFLLN